MNDGTLTDVPEPFPVPIGLRLNQAARAVERAFDEALAEAGGTLPIWLILLNLKIRRPGNQRELAENGRGARGHADAPPERDGRPRPDHPHQGRGQPADPGGRADRGGRGGVPAAAGHRGRVRRPAAGRPLRHRCGPARRAPRPASRQRGVTRQPTPRPGPASPTARQRASPPAPSRRPRPRRHPPPTSPAPNAHPEGSRCDIVHAGGRWSKAVDGPSTALFGGRWTIDHLQGGRASQCSGANRP